MPHTLTEAMYHVYSPTHQCLNVLEILVIGLIHIMLLTELHTCTCTIITILLVNGKQKFLKTIHALWKFPYADIIDG